MLNKKALAATAAAAPSLYVEDVFQSWLRTGTGADATITTNIDMTEGYMLWSKGRSGATDHAVYDSARGVTKDLVTNSTAAQTTQSTGLKSVSSTGYTVGSLAKMNTSSATYVDWTFRKAEKFFDVVTFTQSGTSGYQSINHNLGSTPGCIFIKTTGVADGWVVYHRSVTGRLTLNTTDAVEGLAVCQNLTSTSFEFNIGSYGYNNGATYVAYLFAHDAGGFGNDGDQSVISCGSYTTDGSGNATVSLGYEPQWLLVKKTNGTSDWRIFDIMRGWTANNGYSQLTPNTSGAEQSTTTPFFKLNATGFTVADSFDTNSTNIYIAIRRGPMKTPESGTEVFVPTVYTGTNVDNRLLDTTIAPDMVWIRQRDDTVLGGMVVGDRLRAQPYLLTGTTAAEVDDADAFDKQLVSTTEYGTAFSSMSGVWIGNDATAKLNVNTTSNNHIVEAFKRAPGFFDVVCYTGTGSATTFSHNLGVAPELMIVKRRSTTNAWAVYANNDNTDYLVLNTNAATVDDNTYWNDTSPTSSVFSVGTNNATNASGSTYVAYLFASLSGVSKVGSYTGNGSSVTVTTNFQPRFILVKRTDSTGNWIVSDSARGLVAGNDPYLLLNSTAAEDTDEDWVDVSSTGFTVNETTANANVNTGTYLYLAIS